MSYVTHRNALLTPAGRRKRVGLVVEDGWLQTRVAKRLQVSQATVSKWVRRYWADGLAGLADRSSKPHLSLPRRPGGQAHGAADHRAALHPKMGTAPDRLPPAPAAVDGVEGTFPSFADRVVIRFCRSVTSAVGGFGHTLENIS